MEEQDASVSLLERLLQHAARHGAVQRLLRPRPRRLRRARAHGAREPLQRRERHLPRPEHPAGLLAVQHVDARARVGDARVRRAARVPRHAAGRRLAARRACGCMLLRPPCATCDHYIDDVTATDGIPYWDAGAPGLAQLPDWRERPADPFNEHEPVDSSAAAIGAQGLLRLAPHPRHRRARARSRSLPPGRLARPRHAVRRVGPVPQHRPAPPGAAAALGVSLAEPVGLRAAGREHAARRVEPVGRLSRAGSRRSTSSVSPKSRRI